MNTAKLVELTVNILYDHKALQITTLEVTALTDIADYIIICSATSKRHAAAIADKLITNVKKQGAQPLGVEGIEAAEWILIDLQDVIVHIMLPEARDFYALEKLWDINVAAREKYANQ